MTLIHAKTRTLSTGLTAVLAVTSMLPAQHVDIRPYVSGGRIVTGSAELVGGTVTPVADSQRVFGAELGEVQPFFGDEPGFLSEPGAFAGGAGEFIGFDVTAGLQYWTGSGFAAAPVGETLNITKGSFDVTIGTDSTAGFRFAQIEPDGGLHEHLEFGLLGSGGDPAAGIYLLELSLNTTMSGVAASDPLWIVFNNGDTEENHGAAEAWVETNLVPEPGTALSLGCGLGLCVLRRRGKVRVTSSE